MIEMNLFCVYTKELKVEYIPYADLRFSILINIVYKVLLILIIMVKLNGLMN